MKQPKTQSKIKQSTAPAMAPRKAPQKARAGGTSRAGQNPPATAKTPAAKTRRDASGSF